MQLWIYWWDAIWLLRPGCTRLRTFLWFVTCVAGLTVRTDLLGVTSIVRALGLHGRFYGNLLDNFHSTGISLDKMSALWARVVLRLFPDPLRVNGRLVLVGDGIKVPKSGKKMPAVKLLHQESESNTKPEYIMGHSLQAVSVLVQAAESVFAVPWQPAFMKAWCGPIATSAPCSIKCLPCSRWSISSSRTILWQMRTMPVKKSSPACWTRTII